MSANVQKAVAFFTSAGLSRLLIELREKYIEVGHVGGQIVMEDSTPGERRDIASFLGKTSYPDATFKVRLADVEKALKHSFDCSLPDLLSASFPDQPLVTRSERREAHAKHQASFRTALTSIAAELPEESRAQFWLLHGQHGEEWLFSRYKNAPKPEQEQQLQLVRYIVHALDQLPSSGKPQRLAVFAQRTSGDPHALDPDTPAGRLFLLALHDLIPSCGQTEKIGGQQAPSVYSGGDHVTSSINRLSTNPMRVPQTLSLYGGRPGSADLYAEAGLLVDTISSHVAVFNLAGAVYSNGILDQLPAIAGKRVLLLPLRQLLEWQSILPARADIYVLENPQVFEELIPIAELDGPLPTIVCTSGWPSMAALRLLDLLLAQSSDNVLHYSGDFDLKGLQIAAYLMARYPERCHPWHFDPDDYAVAMQAGGSIARTNELNLLNALPDAFASLIVTMQEKKKWAYQEGIVHLLTQDVRR